ncbi:hypothetical protein JB92DRAFT_891447 [Gautieria morchelliformis]|nr:hypothetical protein JB92DRAFT_891447 [Gautieria morchelliformis]
MFQFLTPFAFVLALGLLLFLILFQLYSFRPSRLCGRSAHEVYAQNLLPDNGFAPWFPGPVNIAEVGYVFFGQWIPFFDTSKEWQEDENKGRSKPEGYYPLVIGEISDKMYSGVPIMKERGSSLAIGTNPPTPSMGAGAPWNFTSSKQEGAILVAGDVIEIRDATETSKFIRYMQEHCVSWVKFIGRPEIRLFDLVLVSGWHKTSSWACATFSDCSSAVHIELAHARGKWSIVTSSGIIAHAGPVQLRTHEQAGESHMPQSEENVNTVDHSSSDHSRKGNLTVPKGLETELNITSGSDKMVRLSQAARRTHQGRHETQRLIFCLMKTVLDLQKPLMELILEL